ncbi:MAG: ubiquinol-cytochrome C chaperone family protein [Rhodospirillaceae bacterium]|nr:ubiquinol-cytochrome C chaperone family protein [Rhodospirillaceae bacterium]
MGLMSFFRRPDPAQQAAPALYGAIVAQARNPTIYADLGVPDTVDGRFDMIVAHAMLVMRRLRQDGAPGQAMAQELFDYMFKDMDRSLRELGVGDMSIGKHVKKMARAFYGRAEEIEQAMDGDAAALDAALAGTVFRKAPAAPAQVRALGRYLTTAVAALGQVSSADVARGALVWPTVELPAS